MEDMKTENRSSSPVSRCFFCAEMLINRAFPHFYVSASLKTVYYNAFVTRLYVSDSVSGL